MGYEYTLSDGEKRELLRIARSTLREHVRSGRIPPGKPHRESLLVPGAVVATLRAGGHVRGRMGTHGEDMPLYRAVQDATAGAASRDPRFEPVSEGEVTEVDIELAVIGPRSRVHGPADVAVSAHGLIVALGGRRTMLLPGAAGIDGAVDAEGFLAKACAQLGADADAWRHPDAVIHVFTAQVFRERDLPSA